MILSTFLYLLCLITSSQDQDFLEHIFQNQKNASESISHTNYISVSGDEYHMDLLGDKELEILQIIKSDGADQLIIKSPSSTEIFKARFDPQGIYSRVYKVLLKKMIQDEQLLVVYYYEGATKYLELNGTSRLYFLTWSRNSHKSFSLFKGPIIWNENLDGQKQYIQRKKEISILDLDGNGFLDVVVRNSRASQAFAYFGNGKWKNLSQF